jgi:hypothetical protein
MADDLDFVPYSQRPEWSDVTPAEAAPGDEGNVVAVKYSKHDRELLGYFRACVAKVSVAGLVLGVHMGTSSSCCRNASTQHEHNVPCPGACKHGTGLVGEFRASFDHQHCNPARQVKCLSARWAC